MAKSSRGYPPLLPSKPIEFKYKSLLLKIKHPTPINFDSD
ncbi:hypothetical protein MTR67_030619 [Solanum verrucosum]|uniref:Uncharacterized protein n=1 Tax=Solanum verrucosum TaxID=315347 RepID=A0AAF0RE93_SOLVR|nr:hypothetical protein MTR67_030619 [Solanum verrucosum]